jgi:Domain of unknown function (DUF5615)
MTIRLYLDEDSMRQALVQALRARGVDVITALEADMIERADEEHLDYATAQGRVLYSFNIHGAREITRRHDPCTATALLRGRADAPSSEADDRQLGRGNEESGGISQCLGLMSIRQS